MKVVIARRFSNSALGSLALHNARATGRSGNPQLVATRD
jgi:hypothetical protein